MNWAERHVSNFAKLSFRASYNSSILYGEGVIFAYTLILQTQSCILFMGFAFLPIEGKKKWKSKKPRTEQFITSVVEKVRGIHVSWQPRGMQHSLFGGSLEKYKSFEIFPLIISCILSIWYIKFIYNKLENQSFYRKRIMCGGDPEDRSDVTE